MKKTKIVCTMGPASNSIEVMKKLLNSGMNVMRMNFSHGDHITHAKVLENMRQASNETGKRVGYLLDTKGPEIRTISLENGKEVILETGQKFSLTTDQNVIGNKNIVAVTYDGLAKDLSVGDTVLIDDGLIELQVTSTSDKVVECVVINSGKLGEKKGVNLRNVSVNLPALSEKDISDLKFGCEQGVDFVAASFIRKKNDVLKVRKVLDQFGGEKIKIISKIENQEGVDNFQEILKASDGIMVARGDLGVEIPVEEVPFVQKMIIKECNEIGKIVITATQMLDSMIVNPRPTRAEASDVANAILDGTDAVMLSGETAKGAYPVESVKVMARIAERTDLTIRHVFMQNKESLSITEAVAKGCVETAEVLNAKLIVVATETGRAANAIRKHNPSCYILAITNNEQTARQLTLSRGVFSTIMAEIPSIEDFHKMADDMAKEFGFAENGDIIVVSCGEDIFKPGTTNNFKVHNIID